MSPDQLEALGYTFVESDLPPIVRDWCVEDSLLCLIEGESEYSITPREKAKPYPIKRVLAGYRNFQWLNRARFVNYLTMSADNPIAEPKNVTMPESGLLADWVPRR